MLLSLLLLVACSKSPQPTTPAPPTFTTTPAPAVGAVTPATPPVIAPPAATDAADAPVAAAVIAETKAKLRAKHGDASAAAIERGVTQVAALWRQSDGDLAAFALAQFVPEGPAHAALFTRLESTLEQVDGGFLEIGRAVKWGTEVEAGPMLPVDELLAGYDAGARL
ncbi:MAG: hypothetical protein NT062_38610, partial [Proteobacteria bacterium]|nr:hypothetical protein [Pseudomonadota bacterium]